MNNKKNIKFYLDDLEVIAFEDESIWEVSDRLGTRLPHLCHSAEPGYRSDGNCRACMVEIEGENVLAASCIRKPVEGMKVKTNTAKASNSPVVCPGFTIELISLKTVATILLA